MADVKFIKVTTKLTKVILPSGSSFYMKDGKIAKMSNIMWFGKREKAQPTLVTLDLCPDCGLYRLIGKAPHRACLECDWREDE